MARNEDLGEVGGVADGPATVEEEEDSRSYGGSWRPPSRAIERLTDGFIAGLGDLAPAVPQFLAALEWVRLELESARECAEDQRALDVLETRRALERRR